ncbi:MAG: UDP-N-acetylmuramate dehydrogenase [Alphaproteobacteria bacterium]|nr:UDP-N-acetylmuramate dehydrogenase [Alphaproteobacteria bacterium]
MTAPSHMVDTSLIDRLPAIKGRLTPQAPLKNQAWLRVGGPAEVLFQPLDEEDLVTFLKNCPLDIPVMVLGVGSNLLIRDGGIHGVVIKMGPAFGRIQVEGDTITAGAAAMDLNIARAAKDASLAGFEFLCGIPGTLGGALRMNAGAHGRETKDLVTSVRAVTRQGDIITLSPADMGFAYRRTTVSPELIFLGATLKGTQDLSENIQVRMQEITAKRQDSQPIRSRTAGSTFANPEGQKAWELIDRAGCRGLRLGGAMMSEQHCNFMINTGEATAADLENLGEEVRRRVKETTGIDLRWEVRRIGESLPPSNPTD